MNIWTPCLLFSKRQMIFILTTIFSIVFYRLPERDTEKVFWEKIDKWTLKFECFCAWFYCPNSEIAPKTSPYDQLPHTFCHRQSTYIYLFHLYLCVHGHAAASVSVISMHICSHGCGGQKSILLFSRSNPSCFWRQSLSPGLDLVELSRMAENPTALGTHLSVPPNAVMTSDCHKLRSSCSQ